MKIIATFLKIFRDYSPLSVTFPCGLLKYQLLWVEICSIWILLSWSCMLGTFCRYLCSQKRWKALFVFCAGCTVCESHFIQKLPLSRWMSTWNNFPTNVLVVWSLKVAASATEVRNRRVDAPLLQLNCPFDHGPVRLAFCPDINEHWTMDRFGPVQYINQTCYLHPKLI